MKTFYIKKDELIKQWWRYYYTVEADSIEEAVEMVKNNEVDPKDSDILFNLEDQDPLEVEIMDENENVLYRK
jgi:hypothetical protein